jgi:hypothetical protein
LALEKSSLAEGRKQITPLMGSSTMKELKVGTSGGFANFKPVDVLQPYETIILQLGK